MAGLHNGKFVELVSSFIREKLQTLEDSFGRDSVEWQSIARQYLYSPLEKDVDNSGENSRHFESEVSIFYQGKPLVGVERLYKRTILVEPTTTCASHCRWCVRGQYQVNHLKEEDIERIADYIGNSEDCVDLNEILITGGDPFMAPKLLRLLFTAIIERAPKIKTIRIGSRTPLQAPDKINDALLSVIKLWPYRLEVAINVCHPLELWPESVEAINKLQTCGAVIYNQNPLLKGVNDNLETLCELYDKLRSLHVESHYLFHAVPMKGMSHHRTSVKKGLELATRLSSSGIFSGRAKPRFALLTDVGKVILYQGSIIKHCEQSHSILVRTGYCIEDRRRYNPSWQLPDSAEIDAEGYLCVWYKDGDDSQKSVFTHSLTPKEEML